MSYSNRIVDALTLAMDLHREQRRKQTDIPYITHLWAVAALVGEHGGNEDQVIAALLHDAIEDQGDKITLDEIRKRFGSRVAEIVAGCTDADTFPKPPWKARKSQYLSHLQTMPPYVKLVSAADKLHNVRAIVRGLHHEGQAVWARFAVGREEQLWYYRGIVQSLRDGWAHPLLDELDRAVEDMVQVSSTSS